MASIKFAALQKDTTEYTYPVEYDLAEALDYIGFSKAFFYFHIEIDIFIIIASGQFMISQGLRIDGCLTLNGGLIVI